MSSKNKFVVIAGIKVPLNETLPPKEIEKLDPFTRASYLISGKIKPQNPSDQKIVNEAKEMIAKGIEIEIPWNN